MKLIDRAGLRYGRLLVLSKDASPRMWLCRCDCGVEKLVTGSNLASGTIRSCGCLAHEWAVKLGGDPEFIKARAQTQVRHGHKRRTGMSIEYATWLGIKRRCYDTRCKDYPNWGGRGIEVCDRWSESFENFLADMGPRPADSYSIDRRNSEGHYSPNNCRWATDAEQGESKRSNIPITVGGVYYPSLSEVCRVHGLKLTTVLQRIRRGGYTAQEAIAAGPDRPAPKRSKESYWRKDRRHATSSSP